MRLELQLWKDFVCQVKEFRVYPAGDEELKERLPGRSEGIRFDMLERSPWQQGGQIGKGRDWWWGGDRVRGYCLVSGCAEILRRRAW